MVVMQKKDLCGMTPEDIFILIKEAGFEMSHAVKVAKGIYKKKVKEISDLPGISKNLKSFLELHSTPGIFAPYESSVSADKTIKYIFRTDDSRLFETVFIPEVRRNTVCVSSQSGCRMGCSFCATGGYGFHGNLSAGEIINQIISLPEAIKIDHIVFMGMGEPMDNLEEVLRACEILTSEWGLSIGISNITVSTVGITPGIEKFLSQSKCNMTFSLFSPFAEERSKVVPAEKKYPANGIISLLKNYKATRKRRLSIAYIMIDGLNDTSRHLQALVQLLSGTEIRVNLIPYHTGSNDSCKTSPMERLLHFKHVLVNSGISASIRKSRGEDISAACGLLASQIKTY